MALATVGAVLSVLFALGTSTGAAGASTAPAIAPSGTVTGTARDSAGAGIADVTVEVLNAYYGTLVTQTSTASDGTYAVADMPSYPTILRFSDRTGAFATRYYDGTDVITSARWLAVAAGTTVVADVRLLHATGILLGSVTGSGYGNLGGILVEVLNPYYGTLVASATSYSSGTGFIFRNLPAGSYLLRFTDPKGVYAPLYYPAERTAATAKWVKVLPEGSTYGSVKMTAYVAFSGRVTAGGAVLPGAYVAVTIPDPFAIVAVVTTDANGRYSIPKLLPGKYKVGFADPAFLTDQRTGFRPQLWGGLDAGDAATAPTNYAAAPLRSPQSGTDADLQGAQCDPATYHPDADLHGRDLSGLRLQGCSLARANLAGADLTGTSLVRADLTGANLRGATVTGADLTAVTLPGADLRGATLTSTVLTRADLTSVDLHDTDLRTTGLASANLTGVDLRGADLRGTVLTGANLTNAPITGALVEGALLSGATFTGVVSGGLVGTPGAVSPGVGVRKGYLIASYVVLTRADLSGANLSGLSLYGANVDGVRSGGIVGFAYMPYMYAMVNGYIVGPRVDLEGADFAYASGFPPQLTGANLRGANLTAARVYEVNLTGSSLAGANLYAAELRGDNLTAVDLTGANLDRATLTQKVTVTNAAMTGISIVGLRSETVVGSPAALSPGVIVANGFIAGPGAFLENADLANADITGLDLTGASVTGLRSGGVTGVPAVLPPGWFVRYGYLMGPSANLNGVDLHGADLSGLDLHALWMVQANLRGARLVGTDLHGSGLDASDLSGADLTGADLEGASLNQATLNGTTIAGAKLASVGFRWTVTSGLIGTPATLDTDQVVHNGFLVADEVDLSGRDLRGIDLHGIYLRETNLSGADLRGVSFAGASLVATNLNGALLGGADLTNVYVWARIEGADLAGANLTGANLFSAQGTPLYAGATFANTWCPDYTNSDAHGGTCQGHPWP